MIILSVINESDNVYLNYFYTALQNEDSLALFSMSRYLYSWG